MDEKELTLRLISDKIAKTGQNSVFMKMEEFPWYGNRNGQLDRIYRDGYISKPRFFDNGVEIGMTDKGRHYISGIEVSDSEKPSVFISYNWEIDSLVDKICDRLDPFADVKRDKRDIESWGSITQFMKSIRNQDFVVLVISDKYMKSIACLYEVMQLMKDEHWDERVMYVITDGAQKIYKSEGRMNYIGYWEEEERKLNSEIDKHDITTMVQEIEELKKIQLIKLNISDFLKKVVDAKNPPVDTVIDKIVARIERNSNSTTLFNRIAQSPNISPPSRDYGEEIILREGWNFHGDIAIRLEMEARHIFGDMDRPYTKIYDADAIEMGYFAEVMVDLLREKSGRDNNRTDIDQFIKDLKPYIGKNGYEIPHKIAQGLLNRFFELIQE